MKVNIQMLDGEWINYDDVDADDFREGVYILRRKNTATVIPIANFRVANVEWDEQVLDLTNSDLEALFADAAEEQE